jgi:aryl-alcohol dehydrogenase-like predicted oxidoreductase
VAYGAAGAPPEPALAVARRRGVSVYRVLLAWLRQQSPNIVPLAGASRPASIRDSAALLDLEPEELRAVARAAGAGHHGGMISNRKGGSAHAR